MVSEKNMKRCTTYRQRNCAFNNSGHKCNNLCCWVITDHTDHYQYKKRFIKKLKYLHSAFQPHNCSKKPYFIRYQKKSSKRWPLNYCTDHSCPCKNMFPKLLKTANTEIFFQYHFIKLNKKVKSYVEKLPKMFK